MNSYNNSNYFWSMYIAAASSIGIDDPVLIVPDIEEVGNYRIDDLEPGIHIFIYMRFDLFINFLIIKLYL